MFRLRRSPVRIHTLATMALARRHQSSADGGPPTAPTVISHDDVHDEQTVPYSREIDVTALLTPPPVRRHPSTYPAVGMGPPHHLWTLEQRLAIPYPEDWVGPRYAPPSGGRLAGMENMEGDDRCMSTGNIAFCVVTGIIFWELVFQLG